MLRVVSRARTVTVKATPGLRSTRLREVRAAAGLKQSLLLLRLEQAAPLLEMEVPPRESLKRQVSRWENGAPMSAEYRHLFCHVYGMTEDELGFVPAYSATEPAPSADELISDSARQATDLIERVAGAVEPLSIEQYAADVARLAAEYMHSPPLVMAQEAKLLRDRLMAAQERTRRPSQLADLFHLTGRASGILAYAALDLDNPRAAMTNARSALACADLAGHTGLSAWVRGTQSLIARYAGRHTEAERYALAGIDLRPRGIALARLSAGHAQCRAQLGDVVGTHSALDLASDAHGSAPTLHDDDETGLFGFPRSKVHYYAASALVCLPNNACATVAAREAEVAIGLFRESPAEERFITDEVLVHIHGANAHLQRGHLDAAAQFLGPVFALPSDQRVSWHRQRLAGLAPLLAHATVKGTSDVAEIQARIATF